MQQRLLQQVQPGMQASASPEAPQAPQAPATKADQFRNSMSSMTSGKIRSGNPQQQLDEINRDLERNTQDASIGDEWVAAAKSVCAGQEAALFMHIKATTQRWSQTAYAVQVAEASTHMA